MVTDRPRGIDGSTLAPEPSVYPPKGNPVPPMIAQRLRETIGLKLDAVSARKVMATIEARLAPSGHPSPTAYYRQLEGSSPEWQELIEEVLVSETWFFRHRDTFAFLDRYLREWQRRNAGDRRPLRVLSLPCATGEEPYSLAIRLLELGISPREFHLDAIDLSLRNLQTARKGIYYKSAFREGLTARERRHFQVAGEGVRVSDRGRSAVRFYRGNLLEERRQRAYDLVFCRHLLIYVDDSVQAKAIANLHRLLEDGGLLVVGTSETGMLKAPDWEAIDPRRGYLYRKSARGAHIVAQPITCTVVGEPDRGRNELEIARELANRGELALAGDRCRRYLQKNPLRAPGYLLLGEIDRSLGAIRSAENHFQKALYLDPDCTEALIHLALLREGQGDFQSSIAMRRRLQRTVAPRSFV